MYVYIVRHGETKHNAKRIHQDDKVPLSSLGKNQAEYVAKRFDDIEIDLIIASPLVRTQQTADIIARRIDVPVALNSLAKELKKPSIFEGRYYDDPNIRGIKEQLKQNFHNPTWRHSDEETFFDLKYRAIQMIKELESRQEKNIILVTHAGIISYIVLSMMHGPHLTPEQYLSFRYFFQHGNTGITLCKFTGKYWKLISWNDLAHLQKSI